MKHSGIVSTRVPADVVSDGSVTPPACSLIVATVGRMDSLIELVESLAGQTRSDFELIIVDQNSDDLLAPVVTKANESGLTVRYLRQTHPNLSAARNLGIEHATAPIVAFPDDDCWYEPDCIDNALQAMPDHDGVIACWVELNESASGLIDRARLRRYRSSNTSSISLFLSRDSVDAVGGFDTQLGVGQFFGCGEETDLVLRLLDQGARLKCTNTARVHHAAPIDRPGWSATTFRAVRSHGRGVGALYRKHRFAFDVIVRGMFGPFFNSLKWPVTPAKFAYASAMVLGRLEGLIHWHPRR